jgi:cellulose biosynthesis protein BcsQ
VLVTLWSTKGGAGTSVTAAALALVLARRPGGALLVDTGGDQPAVLGMAEPDGPGVADWLAAGTDVPADGLARIERPVHEGLALLPRGEGTLGHPERSEVLAAVLARDPRAVVVDAACLGDPAGATDDVEVRRTLAAAAVHSLLVTRPCYLALRRAVGVPLTPSGLVVVHEPGRVLDADDVAAVLDAPVLARVTVDPAVSRAVDAGLLAGRLPRGLERALRHAA